MSGVDAFGTQFKRNTTGSTYVTIANVTNISGPSRSRESIDVTAHDSANQYREFVKGLKDGGEVVITLNYDPSIAVTGTGALEDDFEEDTNRNYQIVILPGEVDEHTWTIEALITAMGDEFPVDDKMEREVTFKISGKPTIALT